MQWRLRPLAAAVVAAGALGPTDGRAASLTVTTLAESSGASCTLRDAVDSINAQSDQGACIASGTYGSGDAVSFDPALSGTLVFLAHDPLSGASALVARRSMDILGPGSSVLNLACGNASIRLMEIDAGAAAVALSGMTIANCIAAIGGGILVDAQASNVAMSVQLTDVTLGGNRATRGGGLGILGGPAGATVTFTACDVRQNTATLQGGGFYISDSSGGAGTVLDVADSATGGNGAQAGGGAYVAGASTQATFTRATIDANRASIGAAIETAAGADVTVLDSTLSNNQATATGGGAHVVGTGARFRAVNSTFSGNTANRGGALYALGIGAAGLVAFANTTVANNRAGLGSGVMVENTLFGVLTTPANVVSIVDTIVAGNTSAPDVVSLEPNIVGGVLPWDVSYSVIGATGSVTIVGTGNVTDASVPPPFGASGWLGPLQDNGGPTQTLALLSAVPDPAIDAGDPAFSGLAHDQRGAPFKRVRNGRVDIGAYESRGAADRPKGAPAAPVPGPGDAALALLASLLAWLGWRLRPRR
jgi:hypothetical protein